MFSDFEPQHPLLEEEFSRELSFCDKTLRIYVGTYHNKVCCLYSEYCEYGDLADVIHTYRNLPDIQIPEAFIWLVFHSLAEAIFAFNTGKCAEDQEKNNDSLDGTCREGWHPRIHFDIKPENIFLASNTEPYRAYPRVILADYDAMADQGDRPDGWGDRRTLQGTPGYQAPEIVNTFIKNVKLRDKVDIWGVGIVIWELIHATLEGHQWSSIRDHMGTLMFTDGDTFPSDDITGYNTIYSKPLHDLMRECLQLNPRKRPGFKELRERTRRALDNYLKNVGSIDDPTPPPHLRLQHLKRTREEFEIGERFVEPDRKKLREQGA